MNKIGVVSFSGGQDSTTVLAYAKKLGYELYALSFIYRQTLSREINQAKKICEILKVKHKIFDISTFKNIAWFSALTNPDFPIPEYEKHEELEERIPFTYVPFRNSFFLVCCAAFLESVILKKIEMENVEAENIEACIFIAANFIDYTNYPDCRPEFFKKAEEFLRVGSKLGTFYNIPIKIESPIINLSKKEITELGIRLRVPLHLTQTCYVGEEEACGECPSCLLRIKGFKEAGYIDPIKYKIPVDWSGCKEINFEDK
ncbi:MAG TPA: 7-cyano-7-deazaguanine synthase QueC [Archaeoglobaceae archaeon]|nr:7-cyano-7-deazaguanine synthase QueC [Archaeoglobaceae archaeon]